LSNPANWLNDTGKLAKGAFDIKGLFVLEHMKYCSGNFMGNSPDSHNTIAFLLLTLVETFGFGIKPYKIMGRF